MSTVPLSNNVVIPGASHQIIAPGGAEAWHAYLEDDDGRWFLHAALWLGSPYAPEYQKRLDAYRKNPTQNTPPTPGEFPGAVLTICQVGQPAQSWVQTFPAGTFTAAQDHCAVSCDGCTIEKTGDGYHVCFRQENSAAVDLNFTNSARATADAANKTINVAGDFYSILQPTTRFTGNIKFPNRPAESISARGSISQTWRTTPRVKPLQWLLNGQATAGSRTALFRLAVAKDSQAGALAIDGPDGLIWQNQPATLTSAGVALFKTDYPANIDFGDALKLREPTLVATTSIEAIYKYDAYLDGESAFAFVRLQRNVSF